jgi:hypothetical protein
MQQWHCDFLRKNLPCFPLHQTILYFIIGLLGLSHGKCEVRPPPHPPPDEISFVKDRFASLKRQGTSFLNKPWYLAFCYGGSFKAIDKDTWTKFKVTEWLATLVGAGGRAAARGKSKNALAWRVHTSLTSNLMCVAAYSKSTIESWASREKTNCVLAGVVAPCMCAKESSGIEWMRSEKESDFLTILEGKELPPRCFWASERPSGFLNRGGMWFIYTVWCSK